MNHEPANPLTVQYAETLAAALKEIEVLRAACKEAASHIEREHARKVWNEHYSWDSTQANEYVRMRPLPIVRHLRSLVASARGEEASHAN